LTTAPVFLCRDDELAERESRGFDPWNDGHDTVLLVRHGGGVYGWRDACPHHGGTPMAWRKDAYLNYERNRIVCAAHGAQFDIESGALPGPVAPARRAHDDSGTTYLHSLWKRGGDMTWQPQ
jgi:nitrite reductase/ring-hydroxylating ferredoxin subunit